MNIEPMLCLPAPELPEGDQWAYEIKWDGYRAIATKHGRRCDLRSRNAKSLAAIAPQVRKAIGHLPVTSVTFDGELVAFVDGKPSFAAIQNHRNLLPEIRMVAFDLLEINGRDVRQLKWSERRRLLERLIPHRSDHLMFSRELPQDPTQLMQQAQQMGLEGIVAKRRESKYESGERSGAWTKWKAEHQENFIVGGFIPSSRNGFDELLVGVKKGRRLFYVSSVRAGFSSIKKAQLMEKLRPLLQTKCPFANLPETGKSRWGRSLDTDKMLECRWVKPTLDVSIAFVEWTEGEKLRHSRFLQPANVRM